MYNKYMNVLYREADETALSRNFFKGFNRYQKVTRCWRKEAGGWVLKDIAFEETWSEEEKEKIRKDLKETVKAGGAVFMALHEGNAGFCAVKSGFFGSRGQYLELSELHVSSEKRRMGIGKQLFMLAAERAKAMGAKKLYISAHSSKESQAFYKAVGCVEAEEYNPASVEKEPCDCQLEYRL